MDNVIPPPNNPLTTAMKNQIVRSSKFLGEPEEYDPQKEVAIIKGLGPERYLQIIELRLRGYRYDYAKREWIIYRTPVMNEEGIGNIMVALQSISDNVYFSNFEEKEIPRLTYYYFQTNYPHFAIYATDFGLKQQDLNIVESILLFFALAALKSAKNAGHRNVVRGTLSEQVYMKAFDQNQQMQNQKKGFSLFRNPFKRNSNG